MIAAGRHGVRALTLSLAAAFAACQPTPSATPSEVVRDDEIRSLTAAAMAYQAAASAKDADAVVSMYDETAIMVPPNAEIVDEGLEGVRNYRFGFIVTPGVELDFELQRVEVSASGDIGWTFAIGQITINREGEPPGRDVVRDFHTWKKQSDGTWKIVVDMWNSGMPAS